MSRLITGVILANTATVAAGFTDHDLDHALEPLHVIFSAVFIAEIVWRLYRREKGPWMAFDTAVIGLSLLPAIGESITVLRVARLARVTHTLRHAVHLRMFDLLRAKPLRLWRLLVH